MRLLRLICLTRGGHVSSGVEFSIPPSEHSKRFTCAVCGEDLVVFREFKSPVKDRVISYRLYAELVQPELKAFVERAE